MNRIRLTAKTDGGHDADMRIGDIQVTRVLELELPVPPDVLPIGTDPPALAQRCDWAKPHFVSPDGSTIFALTATCVRTPDALVVVDPCISYDDRFAQGRDEQAAHFLDIVMSDAGFSPDDVDLVVNTPCDGLGWNVRPGPGEKLVSSFSNATHAWSRLEIERIAIDQREDSAVVRRLSDEGRVTLVDAPASLTGGVHVEPSPGHTPGNLDVWISSGDAHAVVVGDAVLSPMQLAEPGWTGLDMVDDAAPRLRRALFDRCVTDDVLMIGPHFGTPGAGRVAVEGEEWKLVAETV